VRGECAGLTPVAQRPENSDAVGCGLRIHDPVGSGNSARALDDGAMAGLLALACQFGLAMDEGGPPPLRAALEQMRR
jgi:hypothetical protein